MFLNEKQNICEIILAFNEKNDIFMYLTCMSVDSCDCMAYSLIVFGTEVYMLMCKTKFVEDVFLFCNENKHCFSTKILIFCTLERFIKS